MGPSLDHRLTPVTASALPDARRVLVLAPHADDEVFGCGGTLHRLVQGGAAVSVIVATDGERGGESQSGELGAARELESAAAARVLGYSAPSFWRLPDYGMRYGEALVARVIGALRDIDADLVFAPAPTELHPDHQALALATAEAVRRVQGSRRIAFYEVSAPLVPNMLIDITAVEDLKREAMRCFPSQLQQQPYDEHIAALNRYRSYTLGDGVRAAEAFFVATAEELASGTVSLFDSALARRRRLGIPVEAREVPLVSVILRSMHRTTLAEALASLAAQTYPNIEALVVNAKGGQHPPLPDFCDRLKMRLLETAQPLGRSAAANAGLDAARGEFVAFLDDDDALDPDHLAQLVAVLRKEGDGAIAYAGVRCVDRTDPLRKTTRVFAEPFDSRAKLLAGNFIPSHAVLFPRQLVENGVRFDENLSVYEDWDFWLQLAEKARFVYLNRVSATYFTGGSSEVSPLAFDPEAVRRAARALFSKWKNRVSPDELKRMGDLYHQTKAILLDTEREVARAQGEVRRLEQQLQERHTQVEGLQARLSSTQADLEQTVASLTEVYGSTSWRVTAWLRWLTTYVRTSMTLWRAGSVAARRAGWGHLARRAITVGRADGVPGVRALVERRLADEPRQEGPGMGSAAADRVLPPPSGKPEILFVSHEASRTGAPIFLLGLIRHLVRELDVGCTILLVQGGELERDFRALGPTVVLGGAEGLDAVLMEALRTRNIRVAYINTISNGALQSRLKALGCPVVCHVHELAFSIEYHFGGSNLRQVLSATDLFLACSAPIRDYLQKLAPETPVELAYPFIDVAATARAASGSPPSLDVPADTIVIGACGSIGWRKGTDLFVQLARRVLALTAKPVMFVWLGGPRATGEYPRLQYEARMLGIDKHLLFPGQVDTPAAYFAQFDIFALPSREDPFPLVMLEAGSLGKPIVCFADAGGTPEVVESDAGLVVPYLDVDAMASAVVRLVEDPELRVRLGENARRKINDRHDVTVGAARIAHTLKPLLARQASSA
jgi:LmbE family N-acetylglucosaminyl deacetylase/glycosyltransferase involved in cell wall biosynthesis/GT2 family glycosyltransferase